MILETGIDRGLAWHYGSPVAEARRMADGWGIAALENREVIEISGTDRLTLLQLISSAQFEGLEPGGNIEAFLLDAQGRIAHFFSGVDDGKRLLAWCEPGSADALVAHLMRMRFSMQVSALRRPDLRLYWVGEKVQPHPTRFNCDFGGCWVITGEELTPDVGTWALDAARIAAGVPRIFMDTDERTIPNEIGLYATALGKGCYPGQETVAKVHTLGRPPRRLVRLHLEGSMSALPEPGAQIMFGGRVVGFVGSAALHHELGPIALGLVKRSVDLAAQLSVSDIPAMQEALVDPNVGLHVRPTLG